jgi:K+-transporting ATPase ATPase B chain
LTEKAERIAREGGTPLAVAENDRILELVYLKDTVRPGMRERFDEPRRMGIRTGDGDRRQPADRAARWATVEGGGERRGDRLAHHLVLSPSSSILRARW